MSERNGPDIAAVYQLLREVAQKVTEHDRRFDAIDRRFDAMDRRFDQQDGKINEIIQTVNEHSRVLADVVAVLNRHEKKLDDLAAGQISLQQALNFYHSAVVGHGLAITDLDERLKRVEQHLRLEPIDR